MGHSSSKLMVFISTHHSFTWFSYRMLLLMTLLRKGRNVKFIQDMKARNKSQNQYKSWDSYMFSMHTSFKGEMFKINKSFLSNFLF